MNKRLLKRYRILLEKVIYRVTTSGDLKDKISLAAFPESQDLAEVVMEMITTSTGKAGGIVQGFLSELDMLLTMLGKGTGKAQEMTEISMGTMHVLFLETIAFLCDLYAEGTDGSANAGIAMGRYATAVRGHGETMQQITEEADVNGATAIRSGGKSKKLFAASALGISYMIKYSYAEAMQEIKMDVLADKSAVKRCSGESEEILIFAESIRKALTVSGCGKINGKITTSSEIGIANALYSRGKLQGHLTGELCGRLEGTFQILMKKASEISGNVFCKTSVTEQEEMMTESTVKGNAEAFSKLVITLAKILEDVLILKNAYIDQNVLILKGIKIETGYLKLGRNDE